MCRYIGGDICVILFFFSFFFNDTATTEIYTLSLHDALPIPLDRPSPADVDRALAGGCVGISLPAGALADFELLPHLDPVLAQIEELDVALYVHPGPGRVRRAVQPASLLEPLWWQALTTYVAQMQAGWHAFATAVRPCHPELRAVFAMLAGLAPLHHER